VDENAYQLKHILFPTGRIAQVLNRVRIQVNLLREGEVVVDLAPLQGEKVKIEPLQVKYDIVGEILQACPAICQYCCE
jgi:hypothetical protein